jgi:endo-1,4-beta-xylanase
MQLHFGVIDGVVKESTRGVGAVLDTASMREVIKIYGDMGLDVHISEFDVHLPQNPSESDFQIQADAYKAILKVALESPNCKSFITWGTADEKGWKPDGYNPHSLWLGEGFKPKENYFAVLEMLQEMAEDK